MLPGDEQFLRQNTGSIENTKSEEEFPNWKTVKLGALKSGDAYRKALKKVGMKISAHANDLLHKIAVAPEETDVDLVVASVDDLGLNEGGSYKSVYARGLQLGLVLCPAEVGPALRLSHNDQPRGGWLRIAMEPITNSEGDLNVFELMSDGGKELRLGADDGNPDGFLGPYFRLIFMRPK